MPIQLPAIDDRDHAALVRDTLALAALHAPEWTHTGPSDPGVTLVELFAFMAESLLYRANLIPERNRLKFLQLLGIGLRPAQPAQALVQFSNEAGERKTITLASGLPLVGYESGDELACARKAHFEIGDPLRIWVVARE